MARTRRFPTLLISGFAGGSLPFLPLQRALRRRGIDAARWNSPLVYTGPIGAYAERLGLDVRLLAGDPPSPDGYGGARGVTLVGWSEGGLVALAAALDPKVEPHVRRVIAYGAPLEGTWAAHAGVVTDSLGLTHILEMAPGSSMLRRLRHDLERKPRRWDFYAVNGRLDFLARGPLRSVPRESRLSGPYFHVSPLFDPRLHRLIGDLLLRP